MPNLFSVNTTKRKPSLAQNINNSMEKKMNKIEKINVVVKYHNPEVEFFGQPNNTGFGTNVELTMTDGNRSTQVIAQVTDSGNGFYLSQDSSDVASSLGVTTQDIDDIINTPEFDDFCTAAIESAYMNSIDSPAAEAYLNDDEVDVLYDCQAAFNYWSPVVVKKGDDISIVALNSSTGEIKTSTLDEDDLTTIDDELEDKPWSDYRRAEYLLSWVGV